MTDPQPSAPSAARGVTITGRQVRLVVALALFAGWMGWLGYTALKKGRVPLVSRAQVAGMFAEKGVAVVAAVAPDPDGKPAKRAQVIKTLTPGAVPAEVEVPNLPDALGFEGPGEYLLLLAPADEPGQFRVVGRQSSPGYPELAASGHPVIYRWSAKLQAEAAKLFP